MSRLPRVPAVRGRDSPRLSESSFSLKMGLREEESHCGDWGVVRLRVWGWHGHCQASEKEHSG